MGSSETSEHGLCLQYYLTIKGNVFIFLACSHMEEPLGHDINEEAMEDRPLIPFPGRSQGCQTHEHRK